MAAGDYRSCDVCDCKAFYDANLNYEQGPNEYNDHRPPYKIVGEPQFDKPENVEKYGYRLDYLGDWAVICNECSKTHKVVIVPTEESAA